MSSSSPCRFLRRSSSGVAGFILVAASAVIGCNTDAPADARFEDPAVLRPNASRKPTVVFVDGVARPVSSAAAPMPQPRAAAAEAPAMRWDLPEGWSQVPPSSPMRLAEYRVPSLEPGGVPAEVSVFHLGPAALAVDETLQRWASSFDGGAQAKRSQRRAGPNLVHVVETSGTYKPTGMGMESADKATEHPGWSLVGAIVETPMGPYYFKLLGPQATVSGAREAFLRMIDSVGPGAGAPLASVSASPSTSAAPAASSAPSRP